MTNVIVTGHAKTEYPAVMLVKAMRKAGMVKQPEEQLYKTVKTEEELAAAIDEGVKQYSQVKGAIQATEKKEAKEFKNYPIAQNYTNKLRPEVNVAVFCSASTKNQEHLDMAFRVGKDIANKGYGIVFGAGNVAMMGQTAKGAKSAGGYVAGHTTPVFYEEEFKDKFTDKQVSEYLDRLHFHPDIYVRMKEMFKQSDALVVEPGGLGTVQEMFAAFHVNRSAEDGKKKPIIFVNKDGFYDQVIQMAKDGGYELGTDFQVVAGEQELSTELDALGAQKRDTLQDRSDEGHSAHR